MIFCCCLCIKLYIPLIKTSVHFSVLQRVTNIHKHIVLIWKKVIFYYLQIGQTFRISFIHMFIGHRKLSWIHCLRVVCIVNLNIYSCAIIFISYWSLSQLRSIVICLNHETCICIVESLITGRAVYNTQWMGHPPVQVENAPLHGFKSKLRPNKNLIWNENECFPSYICYMFIKTYFSLAWASDGTVDPFPLAYMLGAELSRTCQTIKDDTDPVAVVTSSCAVQRRQLISQLFLEKERI